MTPADRNIQWEPRLFGLLCVVALLPVWLYPGFLTADGPCHVYNAGILYDLLHGKGAFYTQYYELNKSPEPNWFSHAFLVGALHVVSGAVAEKILISLCLLAFAVGFRALLHRLAEHRSLLSLWIFPFLWQAALLMGFYNYMASIGVGLGLAAWYMGHKEALRGRNLFIMALGGTLLFFMHLVGCFVLLALCGLWTLLQRRDILRKLGSLTLAASPMLVLTAYYILHSPGGEPVAAPATGTLLSNLNNLRSLFGLSHMDTILSMKMSFVLQAMLALALISFFIRKPRHTVALPLAMLALLLGAYFLSGSSLLGGSYIHTRLEALVYVFSLLVTGYAAMGRYLRLAVGACGVFFSLAFVAGKISSFSHIEIFHKEMQEAGTRIPSRSVVLPLNFQPYLYSPQGEHINRGTLLFSHIAERINQNKQLILLDNYEAATGYFPLNWLAAKNPFVHLAAGTGLEEEPLKARIAYYHQHHEPIDYIILWGINEQTTADPLYPEFARQLSAYLLIHTSPVYGIRVYRYAGDHRQAPTGKHPIVP